VIRRLPRLATPVAAALATAVLAVLFLVPAAPAATARVYWTQPTPVQQARFTVKPGGNVSFTLAAATTRKRGIVHIAATRSLPGGAYLRWADGVKKAHATFTWSPTAPGDYTITFKASLVGSSTAAPFRSYAIHVTGKAIPYPVRHVLTTTTVARWSPVLRKAVVRAQPRASARRVTTLGTITSDAGTQELVLVLNSVDLSPTKTWYRIRLPILPNNSTGWVPAGDLGDVYTVRTHLYVDTKRFRRHADLADAARPVLRPQQVDALQRPVLRARGLRDERALREAHRLARRRLRRHPRHQPAGHPPRPRLPRLCPPAERQDPEAGEPDAGRHAGHHSLGRAPRVVRRLAARGLNGSA
jgi:hypothetical protein